jgi:hypothetical protein
MAYEHAGEHREHEAERGGAAAGGGDDAGAGAEAAQAPADAEHGSADDEGRIEVGPARQVEANVKPGLRAAADPRVCERVDGDGAGHDEREAGVPAVERIEEADDPRRLGHARDHQPSAEQRAGQGRAGERGHPAARDRRHDSLPAIIAVIAPVIMKVTTATSERADPRDSPQTP